MFTKIILNYPENLFPQLFESTDFESITKGRLGAVLVDTKNGVIPIVRTTTKYAKPAQKFLPIHHDIIKRIRQKTNLDIGLNNALIELYDNTYCTMGFHSDQALDLELESYIAIYSCYENPQNDSFRKLIVKNKQTNTESEIIMEHNSVILFDLSTNSQHLHKIILENTTENNRWIGITFRLSKTFIKHIDGIPYFYGTDKILRLATDTQTKNFYQLRSKENKSLEFQYPEIDYTISNSDILTV